MPMYNYKVRDSEGKLLQGQIEAADTKDLRKKLEDKKYFVVEFSESHPHKDIWSVEINLFAKKVTYRDLAVFSWQLYTMLDAGLPLSNALRIIEKQTKNSRLKTALHDVGQQISEGNSFSESLKKHPKIFTAFYTQTVGAGEVGGVLDEMIRRLAVFYENQAYLRDKIRAATTYPVALMTISIGVVLFMIMYILPRFSKIFDSMDIPIPVTTSMLLNLSGLLVHHWHILVILLGGAYFLYINFNLTSWGRYQADLIMLRLPIIGDMTKKIIAARFTQTLSTLISAGIPILTSLDVVIETVHNRVVEKSMRKVSQSVGEGKSITTPLEESGIFPEMVVGLVRAGEETGSLDKMLDKIGQFYTREVDNTVEIFTKLIEPILIVVMTIIIGFIAASIFLPMTNLMKGMHI